MHGGRHRAGGGGTSTRPGGRRGFLGRARSSGTKRQRAGRHLVAAAQRQREPEAGALAGLAPRLQPALVQPGVLDADRQAEPGAAGAAHPRRVGAPEPAEHQLLLAGPQPDAVVADGDRDGVFVDGHPDPHRLALGVVDGVGDQVAQDALHPARVDLGDDRRRAGAAARSARPASLGEVADVVQRASARRRAGRRPRRTARRRRRRAGRSPAGR